MEPYAEIVGELIHLPDRATYLQAANEILAHLFPCDAVGWNAVDLAHGTVEVIGFPQNHYGLDPELAMELLAVADDHPMILSYLNETVSNGLPCPRRLSDLLSIRDLRRTRTYALLLRARSLDRQITMLTARLGPDSARCWSLSRSGADFTDEDVVIATHLQPMLRLLDLAYLPGPPTRPDIAQYYGLTSREMEVLRLLQRGLTATAAGHLLGICPRTVSKHLENAYAKLGCNNRVTALALISAPAPR